MSKQECAIASNLRGHGVNAYLSANYQDTKFVYAHTGETVEWIKAFVLRMTAGDLLLADFELFRLDKKGRVIHDGDRAVTFVIHGILVHEVGVAEKEEEAIGTTPGDDRTSK